VNILHCIPTLSGGGAERQLSSIAPIQAQLGHEVTIAYVHDGPDMSYRAADGPVRYVKLKASRNTDPMLLWRLGHLMRRVRADVVHTWIVQMDIAAGLVASTLSVPWILREPSSAAAWPDTPKFRLRQFVARGAAAIVANSAGGDDYWRRHAPYVPRHVVPNGLAIEAIAAARAIDSMAFGIPATAPVVLFAGRVDDNPKNVTAMVEAFIAAAPECPAHFVICGEGPARDHVESRVRSTGLADRIHFFGYRTDIWRWMKRASVFISLSSYEGQSNSLLEAIACRTPLLLSDIPAHRDIVGPDAAKLVDAHDAATIPKAILEVLGDSAAADRRAEAAARMLGTRSFITIAQKYCAIYEGAGVRRR
jgi:glycosyltransferase involved in cell wall biosynthesis